MAVTAQRRAARPVNFTEIADVADSLAFVQISDIHMGDSLQAAILNQPAGLLGHDPNICRILVERIEEIAARYKMRAEQLKWIVSGDLTRVGEVAEFRVARDFMESVSPRDVEGRPLRPTLGVARNRYVDVPGNHDHFNGWNAGGGGTIKAIWAWLYGNPPPAWNRNLFPHLFEPCPWDNRTGPWMSTRGTIQLELFGVDSDSGLAGQNANRFAYGSISDPEFQLLEHRLATSRGAGETPGVTRVRAIVCHHAFTRRPQDGVVNASPLEDSSRLRLLELAAQYRVAAVLTGHTHRHRFDKRQVPFIEERRTQIAPVYEIRSPTTLQGTRTLHEGSTERKGFWIHRLVRRDAADEVEWEPRLYLYAGGEMQPQDVEDLEYFPTP